MSDEREDQDDLLAERDQFAAGLTRIAEAFNVPSEDRSVDDIVADVTKRIGPQFKALAEAMKKTVPPELMEQLVAHLDPLTPFVAFLRSEAAAAATAGIRTDYTREELVAICERAVVPIAKWHDRDSPSTHEKIGGAWVMLKAGCEFQIYQTKPDGAKDGCYTDERTIWLEVHWPNFSDFEYGTRHLASDSLTVYLPTPARLEAAAAGDWY